MTRDDIARAIYIGWNRNKPGAPWEVLGDGRRAQWEAAADEVIALLPPLVRPLPDALVVTGLDTGPAAHAAMPEPERLRLIDRLKRRAG